MTPYLLEARYELLRLSRPPGYAVPTLAFPVMFYLLFGVLLTGSRTTGGRDLSSYLLATYGAARSPEQQSALGSAVPDRPWQRARCVPGEQHIAEPACGEPGSSSLFHDEAGSWRGTYFGWLFTSRSHFASRRRRSSGEPYFAKS